MSAIAVVGSGAIGQFYGAQFIEGGHDVRFLLRSDYDRVSRNGIVVHQTATEQVASTLTKPTLAIPPTAFRSCRTAEECVARSQPDWVIVAIKTTAFDALGELLKPFTDRRTGFVLLCNGLGLEERLGSLVRLEQVYAAMCFICVNRKDDGVIEHLAHGRVGLGHFLDDQVRLGRLADLFESAGITRDPANCLLEARWRKLAWNIPFNGVSVDGPPDGVTTQEILDDANLHRHAEELMRETIAIGNADLKNAGKVERIDAEKFVPELFMRTSQMGQYLTSTLLDMRAGRAMEIDAMFGEPARRAKKLGVPAPRLTVLHERLSKR